jgi:hypothetical protein
VHSRRTLDLERYRSEVRGLSFSGDGAHLAVAGEDAFLTIVRPHSLLSLSPSCAACPHSQPLCPLQCDSELGEALVRVPCRYKLNALAWHPKLHNLLCVAVDDRSTSPQYLRFICFATS